VNRLSISFVRPRSSISLSALPVDHVRLSVSVSVRGLRLELKLGSGLGLGLCLSSR